MIAQRPRGTEARGACPGAGWSRSAPHRACGPAAQRLREITIGIHHARHPMTRLNRTPRPSCRGITRSSRGGGLRITRTGAQACALPPWTASCADDMLGAAVAAFPEADLTNVVGHRLRAQARKCSFISSMPMPRKHSRRGWSSRRQHLAASSYPGDGWRTGSPVCHASTRHSSRFCVTEISQSLPAF